MKLTVLGNNGPYPSAGGACSGYLIQHGGKNILLDCGNGVLSNLQKVIRFEELDAIIITHLHSDHMSDMMVLRYAIQAKMKRGAMNHRIDVYASPEPQEEFKRLDINDAFNLKAITDDMVLNIGDITVTFSPMTHPFKSFAVCVSSGGKKFVFSGDTSWNKNIIEFSGGADVVMLDAGLLSADKKDDNVPHLTARECGIVAKESGAKKLILTHFFPEYDVEQLIAEARENFGNVTASELMKSYEI
ncbi:MAG TPA: MBL fold metallo-hydrolase [Clostridiaceae bacterium]|nr:MBL fold metallo-hydrolase [Clostridiaceae bacterium]